MNALDTTHKLVALALLAPMQVLSALAEEADRRFTAGEPMPVADVLKFPAIQAYVPVTMPELNLPVDEDRELYLADLLNYPTKTEREWLTRLRSVNWQQVDPGREAAELFHDGFIHRISGRVMYALVKAAMLLQGIDPPTDLNRKMAGARQTVELIRRRTRSETLSPNVPPIHRPATPGSEGGAQ